MYAKDQHNGSDLPLRLNSILFACPSKDCILLNTGCYRLNRLRTVLGLMRLCDAALG